MVIALAYIDDRARFHRIRHIPPVKILAIELAFPCTNMNRSHPSEEEIFQVACELSDAARVAYLEQVCGDDFSTGTARCNDDEYVKVINNYW